MPAEAREFRRLTLTEIQGYISELKSMTALDIKRASRKKNIPALKAWIYNIAHAGIILGDDRRFDTLMDRVVGRVADQLNIQAKIEKDVRAKSDAELLAEAKALVEELEGAKK